MSERDDHCRWPVQVPCKWTRGPLAHWLFDMHIYLYWLAWPPTFQVTQHETCRVRVTLLNETSDPWGGHKFKLSGECPNHMTKLIVHTMQCSRCNIHQGPATHIP